MCNMTVQKCAKIKPLDIMSHIALHWWNIKIDNLIRIKTVYLAFYIPQ